MNKNFFNQLLLGVAIFLTMMYVMPKLGWGPQPETQTPPPTAPAAPAISETPVTPAAPATPPGEAQATPAATGDIVPHEQIVIDCPEFVAVFTTQGAALKSYTLKNYYNLPVKAHSPQEIPLPLLAPMQPSKLSLSLNSLSIGATRNYPAASHWQLVRLPDSAAEIPGVERGGNALVFALTIGEITLTRRYDFSRSIDKKLTGFDHALIFHNSSVNPAPMAYSLSGPAGIIPDDSDQRFGILQAVSGNMNGDKVSKTESPLSNLGKEKYFDHKERNIVWSGLINRFFAALLIVNDPALTERVQFREIRPNPDFPAQFGNAAPWVEKMLQLHEFQAEALLATHAFTVNGGASLTHSFEFYGGPLSDTLAGSFNPKLDNIVSYSISLLSSISRFLLGILDIIASVIPNYGVAIILLTLVVKLCMHPLTRKTMQSQHKMQQVQPLLKKIKEKYKNDKQKQQQETMRVFQENGVNPLSGCLPMLIQLPIFFALYGVFARSFDIRQQTFIPGWIEDLSAQDALFNLGFSVPYFDWSTFNLLPVIYIVLQIINMRMMPKSSDPQMESQQKMMRIMPVVFGFIFYAMPSGLVLYFVTQSLLSIVEHCLLKKTLNKAPVQPAGAK